MDPNSLARELNAHAEKVASKLGVGAAVRLVTKKSSDVDSGGPRIELLVFRKVSGQMRELALDFRPERADLKTAIEQQIAVMAPQLQDLK